MSYPFKWLESMSQKGRKIWLISRQYTSTLIRVQMKIKRLKIQCTVLELYVSVEDLMYSCCQVTYIKPRNLMFPFFFFLPFWKHFEQIYWMRHLQAWSTLITQGKCNAAVSFIQLLGAKEIKILYVSFSAVGKWKPNHEMGLIRDRWNVCLFLKLYSSHVDSP